MRTYNIEPAEGVCRRIIINAVRAAFALTSFGIVTVSANASEYGDRVVADGGVGYYRMSETNGTTAFDATTPAENGTYFGGVTLGAAGPLPPAFLGFEPTNSAADFDGSDDRLEITSLSLNDPAYSYEVWVNYASNGGLQYFGGRGGTGLNWDSVGVNNQTLLFFNGSTAVFGPFMSQNTWHHLVYTRDGTDVRVYVDGTLAFNPTLANTYGTSDRIVAGWRPDNAVAVNATLDELAIYNTALTADQVAAHYAVAVVPEPTAVLLLGIGALLLWRRR